MAFRGRGRGRGGYGGRSDFKFAKQESFVLFPDIELPNRIDVPLETDLARRNFNLRRYFQTSPYHLEDTTSEKENAVDIERFSDKVNKKSRFGRESLLDSGYLKLEPGYFPLELVRGTKYRTKRKVQWNPKQGLHKLDLLEDLEKKHENAGPKEKKENEGDEDEEEEEEVVEEEDEVESDGDYAQGEHFDDDEDDYNIDDDGEDEAEL